MTRLVTLALLLTLFGCDSSTAETPDEPAEATAREQDPAEDEAPSTPPSDSPSPSDPTTETDARTSCRQASAPAAAGIAFASPAEVCRALTGLGEAWENATDAPSNLQAFTERSGIVRIPVARASASCMATLPIGFAPEDCSEFRCNDNMTACHAGTRSYLLGEGAGATRTLRAVVDYEQTVPPAVPQDVRDIVEGSAGTCDLLTMIRSGEVAIGAEGDYRRDFTDDEATDLAGDAACPAAIADVGDFDGPWLECDRSRCYLNSASNEAELAGELRSGSPEAGRLPFLIGRFRTR